jgi:hypothetical protein
VHPQRYKVLFSIYRDVEKLYPSSGIAKFISWLSGRFWQRAIRDQKQKAGVVQMCSVKLSEKKKLLYNGIKHLSLMHTGCQQRRVQRTGTNVTSNHEDGEMDLLVASASLSPSPSAYPNEELMARKRHGKGPGNWQKPVKP